MTKHNQTHDDDLQPSPDNSPAAELDPASKSLSEALRISFITLKIIMIVLVVLFLMSGFETVGSDEQALVLRFGKIRGVGKNKILKPRAWPYWVFPYPIEEIVKIPVGKKVDLPIRSFWYYQSKQDLLDESQGKTRPLRNETLDPITDGYCLTSSEKHSDALTGSEGSDYNIVHSKWQLTYQIDDPELFFTNVFVEDLKPGEIYFNLMTKSITPLLKNLLEEAVVTTMVNYTIDEAIKSQDSIPKDVKKLLEEKLRSIKTDEDENVCGIKVVSVYLTDITWPRQVDEAFQAAHKASQESQKAISEARTYARNTLDEAAGPVAEELFAALQHPAPDEQTTELLWSRLSGTAQEKIFKARAYRTQVEASAKANADYFQSLLPEYRRRPTLVIQGIYRDAIEDVLCNVDEKFVIQPTEGEEIRILINRDPTIKRQRRNKQGAETEEE